MTGRIRLPPDASAGSLRLERTDDAKLIINVSRCTIEHQERIIPVLPVDSNFHYAHSRVAPGGP